MILRVIMHQKFKFCDYQVTVDAIEEKTSPKLNIWSDLPDDVTNTIKSQKGTLAKEMGCE
ncbi:putative endonuclease [Yersinia enterocolitica]|nr:putative endonuclease [Yersinia enterocolitica]